MIIEVELVDGDLSIEFGLSVSEVDLNLFTLSGFKTDIGLFRPDMSSLLPELIPQDGDSSFISHLFYPPQGNYGADCGILIRKAVDRLFKRIRLG